MDKTTTVAVFVLLAAVLIICTPLITIWSLNTLFGLGIPYTPATWFAALWITAVLSRSSVRSKRD